MCGICGIVRRRRARRRPRAAGRDERRRCATAGRTARGRSCSARPGWRRGGWRSSTSRAATSRSPTRTGAIVVVQNGEIYNHAALRAELEAAGHRFRTPHSDTEVLVHLYEEHGPRFAERLRGMFAVAVWDRERRRLVLARDRFGIKPLYYRDGADFAFASELKALRALPDLSREVDLDALEAFLAFNAIHGPRTIYRAVRKLPPGHLLVRRGRRGRGSSATPTTGRRSKHRDEPWEALADELRERLRDSVRAHLVADVPVGVLLSGGVDSSALAALAAEAAAASRRSRSASRRSRSTSSSSRARSRGATGPTTTSWSSSPTPPSCCRRSRRRSTSRSRTLRRSPPTSSPSSRPSTSRSRSPARAGTSCSAATRPTSPTRWRCAPAAPRGCSRPLAEALPSGSGRVPLDYKLKRFTRAAHLPPLERHHGWKEIFSPDARAELPAARPPGQRRPARRLPRPLRRDRGRRAARAPAGRRPRDLPRRRPAGEDRPHEHGPLARAARAVPRPGRGRARARAAASRAGARLRQEAPAALAVEPLVGARDRARAQEGLLDPRRRLAARRARAVRPRGAGAPTGCAARATSSPRRSRGCSTSTSPAARTTRASCGDC